MSVEAIKAIQMVYANTTKHDWPDDIWDAICQAIEAEPSQSDIKQKPVAQKVYDPEEGTAYIQYFIPHDLIPIGTKFYTRPYVPTERQPKRHEWVGLTIEEIADQFYKFEAASAWHQFAHAIEAKLKAKNFA